MAGLSPSSSPVSVLTSVCGKTVKCCLPETTCVGDAKPVKNTVQRRDKTSPHLPHLTYELNTSCANCSRAANPSYTGQLW